MTIHVNIAKAKATLSELVARAEAGEEVVLTRHGKPSVHLVKFDVVPPRPKRNLGVWAHLNLDIPASVFDPDPEIEALMDKSIWPDE